MREERESTDFARSNYETFKQTPGGEDDKHHRTNHRQHNTTEDLHPSYPTHDSRQLVEKVYVSLVVMKVQVSLGKLDSSALTHVAAILVGVLVTLFLVGGFRQKTESEQTSRSAVTSAAVEKKKKRKKKKGKGGAATTTNGAKQAPAPVPAAPAKTDKKEEPPKAAAIANGKKKKKKKKAAETKAAEPAVTESNGKENVVTDNDCCNQENNDAELMAILKAIDDAESQPAPNVVEEEWTTTSTKKKKNRSQRPKPSAASAPTKEKTHANGTHANSTPTNITETVSVDAKKIGIIIGPKGATMKAIEEASGCKLNINAPSKDEPTSKQQQRRVQPQMASVVLSGDTKDAIQKAKKAIKELATKGYATLLQADSFAEYSISVHPRFLSEIVGPSGRTIQALQQTLSVNITIPPTDWKPNVPQVGKVQMAKVGIAGQKDNCRTCKQVIQELMKFHHHEITHPGLIHEEFYVPPEFFHCVIGPRGSEIKHIRGNYKVDIYMPNAESSTDNVILVGKKASVDKAISYIQLIMDRDMEQREKRYNDEFY